MVISQNRGSTPRVAIASCKGTIRRWRAGSVPCLEICWVRLQGSGFRVSVQFRVQGLEFRGKGHGSKATMILGFRL